MSLPADALVLIVDDFALAREVLRKPLATMGFEHILEAGNGVEGLKIINHQLSIGQPVSLVICDLNMPTMNGSELLHVLRGHEKFKSLPFVMLTVESSPQTIKRVLDAGATDYLVKPFVFASLQKRLAEIIEKLS